MTTGFGVWDGESERDRESWIELWADSPMQHPFAHPDVCRLLGPSQGRLMAATLTTGSGRVLYPFFLREVGPADLAGLGDSARIRDIVSPYGYGGPLHWGFEDPSAAAEVFWEGFGAWTRAQGVVSEFVRFSLFAQDVLPYPGPVRTRQANYVRDLHVPEEELWRGVESKVRSNARRALREGVSIVVDDRGACLEDFLRIYLGTMERRASADWYRFDRSFFARLHAALPGRFAYVLALLEGEIVSADLLLLGAETGYYFLGGTEASAFWARPNDLVKVEAMRWLRSTGRRHYVLGGGVAAHDGLERYKRGFAPQGATAFLTGERILSPRRYERLEREARARFTAVGADWDETGDFFPAYRRQPPAALTSTGGAAS